MWRLWESRAMSLGSSGPKTLVEPPCGTLIQSVCSLDCPEQARTQNQSKAGLIDSSAHFMPGLAKTIRHTFWIDLLCFDLKEIKKGQLTCTCYKTQDKQGGTCFMLQSLDSVWVSKVTQNVFVIVDINPVTDEEAILNWWVEFLSHDPSSSAPLANQGSADCWCHTFVLTRSKPRPICANKVTGCRLSPAGVKYLQRNPPRLTTVQVYWGPHVLIMTLTNNKKLKVFVLQSGLYNW